MPVNFELAQLTIGQTQSPLKALKKLPPKKLGQNFLIYKNIVFQSLQLTCFLLSKNIINIWSKLKSMTQAFGLVVEDFKNFLKVLSLCL